MFTDMVGYSKKMQADENKALALLEEHNTLLESQIKAFDGKIIKTIGDAFLAEFTSANNAVKSAVAIQKILAERNEKQEEGDPIEVRIGIHIGDVIYRDSDVFGDGVNIASRIESIAGGGQIFISGNVYSTVHGKLDYKFKDFGEQRLKNISKPVEIHEVIWDPARERKAGIRQSKKFRLSAPVISALILTPIILLLIILFVIPSLFMENASRSSLAIVRFSDLTEDENMARLQIDKIMTDAMIQKFSNWEQIHLISPLRLSRIIRENDIDETSLGNNITAAADIAKLADAQLMMTGTISKRADIDNNFIITAEINDIENEELLFSNSAQGSQDIILQSMTDKLADEMQIKIAQALDIEGEVTPIASIGELTTNSLEAYGYFIKGHELAKSGAFYEGIDEMLKAVQIDPDFALAYSLISCTYWFADDEAKVAEYSKLSAQFQDKFTGVSKEALIYRGNMAWFNNELDDVEKYYRLITELYPDDRDGYFYYGTYLIYMKKDYASALSQLEKSRSLSPDYFPTYRESALCLKELKGSDEAVAHLQNFINDYPDSPSIEYARNTIAKLRLEE